MRKHYEPKKRKPIEEITVKKDYSGEASPYWDFIGSHQPQSAEGNPTEDTLANPDVLDADASLYNRPLTDLGRLQMEAINDAMVDLTARQKQVMYMRGPEGFTEEDTARELGISRLAVRNHMARCREAIKKCFLRKLLQEGCCQKGQ